MHSKTMWKKKQRYCGQLHNHVRFQSFRRRNGKTTKLGKHMSTFVFDMEGHANKCVEWCCELADKTTQQLYKVSTPCLDDHQFERRRMEIRGRIVKCMLSSCSDNVCIWHALVDLIFCSQWTNLLVRNHKHGPEHVTNVKHVGSLTFISQVTTNSNDMWETQHNDADWDCFGTLALPRRSWRFELDFRWNVVFFLAVSCLF